MKKTTYITAFSAALLMAATSSHAALNFEILSTQVDIGGSTAVPGGGDSGNFVGTTAVNDYAVFDIQTTDANGDVVDSTYAQLKVTYLSDNGNVGSNLMIGQTTNSQGLTNADGSAGKGTLSILMDIGDTSGGTVTLQFDWYSYGSFTDGIENAGSSLLSDQINYTAIDIDYHQEVSVATADIDNYTLNGVTNLTASDNGTSIVFADGGQSSQATDPKSAVSFTSNTAGSQQITMGKQEDGDMALFVFEFRDPGTIAPFEDPQTTPVPEPAAAGLLIGSTVVAFAMLRRRKRS
jgi:hypothetical protein